MNEKLLRLPDVIDMVGKSKSAIYADMAATPPLFPKSIPIGARSRAWRLSQIQKWIDEKAKEADICA